MTNAQTISDEEKIRQLDAEWGKAAVSHDVDAVLQFYRKDATLVWPGQVAIHGIDAIKKAWEGLFSETKELWLSFVPTTIHVSKDRDLATDFGVVTLKWGPADEQQEVAKYLVVWKFSDGEWKVLYDSYNSNIPPKKN